MKTKLVRERALTQIFKGLFRLFIVVVTKMLDLALSFHNLANMALGLRMIPRQAKMTVHEYLLKQISGKL